MPKYLISFPATAMTVPDAELAAVGDAAHAVVREAQAAGVYVFAGGIDSRTPPTLVNAAGSIRQGSYPQTAALDGGFCVLDLPTREAAVRWAAKLATACRCDQELREFGEDPAS